MWDRIRGGRSQVRQQTEGTFSRPGRRSSRQPLLEVLEDRRLLTASLQPITGLSVPAQQGAVIPLLATTQTPTTDPQTFTVTSTQPNIGASIIQGPFWTVGVSYTDPVTGSNSFTGSLTFQLFPQYTPNTVKMITQFTNANYYVSTGMFFPRIVSNFGGSTGVFVVQGGSATMNGTGTSGQTGTPYPNENVQQLTLAGSNQLALANSDNPQNPSRDTNDTQFFINTGSVSELGYGYTIFGQMLPTPADLNTLAQMAAIPVMPNQSSPTLEDSQPVNPLTITSTTFSSTNPNGVLLIDASQTTTQGETAMITVTATDSVDHTTASQEFMVTIGAYAGPADPPINFSPFANATTANVFQDSPGQKVQLNGKSGYPDIAKPATLSYSLLSQPTHGTVSNFNASTGTFTYTPDKNYLGPDSLQYQVTSKGPEATPTSLTSNPGTVTINVGPGDTGAVRVIGQALVITPVPRLDHGINHIEVAQVPDASAKGGAVIQVEVNGQLDQTQPGILTLDRIIVFGGSKAKNDVVIDPSVKLDTTIDSGHGLLSYLTGGGGSTREHGWFGYTTLIGGPGVNQLIGLAGHVRFRPSKSTNVIYAGKLNRRSHLLHPTPPSGTFYKFVKGRLIPVKTV